MFLVVCNNQAHCTPIFYKINTLEGAIAQEQDQNGVVCLPLEQTFCALGVSRAFALSRAVIAKINANSCTSHKPDIPKLGFGPAKNATKKLQGESTGYLRVQKKPRGL